MEKVVECGVRWKRAVLELSDEDFEKRLMMILPEFGRAIEMQRVAYHSEMALSTAKSGEDAFAAKTVEVYCSIKGEAEITQADQKGFEVECGVRIKQFALDLTDSAFSSYVSSCTETFRTSCMEQRKIFLQTEQAKSAELDEAMKGAEFYCRVKSFCG